MLSHLCVDQPSPCSKGAGPLGWVNAGGQHSKLPGIVVTPLFQPYVTASVATARCLCMSLSRYISRYLLQDMSQAFNICHADQSSWPWGEWLASSTPLNQGARHTLLSLPFSLTPPTTPDAPCWSFGRSATGLGTVVPGHGAIRR